MDNTNFKEINQMFQVYSICTLAIFIKFIFSQLWGSNWENHPKEDTDKFGSRPTPEDIKRRERNFANDLENIPFDMVIFWAAFLVQCFAIMSKSAQMETLVITILIVIYTGMRVLYTIFYLCALQPYRSIAWIIGRLAVLAAPCVLVSSAFKVNSSLFLAKF
jgi:uncharacterized MAPEG superfamily protein